MTLPSPRPLLVPVALALGLSACEMEPGGSATAHASATEGESDTAAETDTETDTDATTGDELRCLTPDLEGVVPASDEACPLAEALLPGIEVEVEGWGDVATEIGSRLSLEAGCTVAAIADEAAPIAVDLDCASETDAFSARITITDPRQAIAVCEGEAVELYYSEPAKPPGTGPRRQSLSLYRSSDEAILALVYYDLSGVVGGSLGSIDLAYAAGGCADDVESCSTRDAVRFSGETSGKVRAQTMRLLAGTPYVAVVPYAYETILGGDCGHSGELTTDMAIELTRAAP